MHAELKDDRENDVFVVNSVDLGRIEVISDAVAQEIKFWGVDDLDVTAAIGV